MSLRRKNNLLVEPPSSATGDIAFNLIVFFLVCASVQPDSGRKQTIPRGEQTEKEKQSEENIQVQLKRNAVLVNGEVVRLPEFAARIKVKLAAKATQTERIVVVKSDDDVEYAHWIAVTSQIDDAGGIVTLQLEEERTVTVP